MHPVVYYRTAATVHVPDAAPWLSSTRFLRCKSIVTP